MNTPLFLFLEGIGGGELVLIMVVILIFFGANKIPELARGLGKGIREFKDASREIRSEFENAGQPQSPYQQQFQQPQAYAQEPVQPAIPPPSAQDVPTTPAVTPTAHDAATPPSPHTPEDRPRLDQLA